MQHRGLLLASFVLMMLVLVSCGSIVSETGDPARGEQLFNDSNFFLSKNMPSCESCHQDKVVGTQKPWPNLSNIGNRAAVTVPGQSPEEYLRTSIVNPDAYLAGGFQEGIMYRQYQQQLTSQQIADLVAYMLTLKSGQDQ